MSLGMIEMFLDPGEKLGELLEGQEKSLSARRKQILIHLNRVSSSMVPGYGIKCF